MLIHIVGGSGGVGASVFAASLGLAAVRAGQSAVLVDLDPFGGGIDFVLAAEQQEGLRWGELSPTGDPLDPDGLLNALPVVSGMHFLSQSATGGGLSAAGIRAVTDALAQRVDLVIVDTPLWLAASLPSAADVVVLIAAATCRGIRSAQLALAALERTGHHHDDTLLMVARDSTRAMTSGRVAEALDLTCAKSWVRDERLALAIECGDLRALETSTKDGLVAVAEATVRALR
jgi:septum formation inhibitor-activating ATPase MinD